MTDIKYLHSEALNMRQRASDKVNEAYQAVLRADTYNKSKQFNKAAIESDIASHAYNEAIQLEHEALDIDQKIINLENKAMDIDRRASELESNTRSRIDILERLKRAIKGE